MKHDKDNTNFEDTGVDYLFVDEAQKFKNLAPTSNRTKNMRDSGATESSDRAFDMLEKCDYLRAKMNGKGVCFLSATPVMNSPVEAYNMLRFVANEELQKRGIDSLDAFINQFGRIEDQLRLDSDATTWKTVTAFSGFINMTEWQQLWGMTTDVVKTSELPEVKLPKMKGGQRNVILCEAGPKAREAINGLADRLKKKSRKGENHVFAIQNDGKKASFTQRFLDPNLPYGANEKVPTAVNEIYKIWKESKTFKDWEGKTQKNGTQLVFCGKGVPDGKDAKTVPVYQDMKNMLIAKGIPAEEIAFIHSAKTDQQKVELYEKVREGKVRILIGNAERMGEGLNVQDRVVALHELDPLPRPGDIEQVEARAIRQKNMSPEVAINVYVTKDSFDTKQWDTLYRKARFISEITSGTI